MRRLGFGAFEDAWEGSIVIGDEFMLAKSAMVKMPLTLLFINLIYVLANFSNLAHQKLNVCFRSLSNNCTHAEMTISSQESPQDCKFSKCC